MSNPFQFLEARAAKKAEELREKACGMDMGVSTVEIVPREEANGTNSLDELFLQSLVEGKHLDEKFLSF